MPILLVALLQTASSAPTTADWPTWRGPDATGTARHASPPTEWSESRNIQWKVRLPGLGLATPIVLADRVIVLAARPTEGDLQPQGVPRQPHDLLVIVLDRTTGKTIWERTATTQRPHESLHPDSTMASASPVTDGQRIYAFFGSYGLYTYDLDGKLLWSKDFGDMETRRGFGEGASPAVYRNTLVIKWDHEGDDFIVALDAKTGAERWRQTRDEPTSWSTPLIVADGGSPQVITTGTNLCRAYDLATGRELWSTSGHTFNTIPSPVYADGLAYLMSGFRGSQLQAVRLSAAEGAIADDASAMAWTHADDTSYVPSPLLYDGRLYFLKQNRGILSCHDARTGKQFYSERLPEIDSVYASPIGAAGRVYVVGRNGVSVVLKAGDQFDVLATNRLDDTFDASPVAVGDDLLLRGRSHLYCISK